MLKRNAVCTAIAIIFASTYTLLASNTAPAECLTHSTNEHQLYRCSGYRAHYPGRSSAAYGQSRGAAISSLSPSGHSGPVQSAE